MGSEPARAEHIGLAVQRLNHSATSSYIIYRGADMSLTRPGRKEARKHVRDAHCFSNIKMRAVIRFFSLQGKAPKEIYAILGETLACFLPGRAKDLSAHLYIILLKTQQFCLTLKSKVFCVMNPYRLVYICRGCGGTRYLHLQDPRMSRRGLLVFWILLWSFGNVSFHRVMSRISMSMTMRALNSQFQKITIILINNWYM